MDPWTLHLVAGHKDMSITRRYVHPQPDTIRQAMEKARTAINEHTSGHTSAGEPSETSSEVYVVN